MRRFRWVLTGLGFTLAIAQTELNLNPADAIYFTAYDTQKVMFNRGVQLYNSGKYFDALTVYQQLNQIPLAKNHFYTATLFMLIKTHMRLGEIEKCLEMGREFESFYMESAYFDDVQYAIAEALLKNGQYVDALLYYLDVLRNTDNAQLQQESYRSIGMITDVCLTTAELESLSESVHDPFNQTVMRLKLAEKYYSQADFRRATAILRARESQSDHPFLKAEFTRTAYRIRSEEDQRLYIGIILPLSGSMQAVGREILDGIRYALHQYRNRSGLDIAGIVLDNRGEMIESIKQVEYLSRNPRVIAIVGPLTSENAIAMSGIVNEKRIPLITPTATHSALSTISPYIFQANVDFYNLGLFLAKFAALQMGVSTVATLSPGDNYGKDITDAFCEIIDDLGGRIAIQQWYTGAPVDLRYQFGNIRQTGLELTRRALAEKIDTMKTVLMDMVATDSVWQSETHYLYIGEHNCQLFRHDSVFTLSFEKALVYAGLMDSMEFKIPSKDSIEYTIRSIDGLLCPVYSEDLKTVLPQLNYFNLQTKIFGSANWNDPDLLKKNRPIARNLYFVSDYYIAADTPEYQTFENYYSRLLGNRPTRFNLYGYDTMQALLSVIKPGETTREDIRGNLSAMPIYRGISRNISFRGNRPRVNSCAFILNFNGERSVPVAYIENGNLVSPAQTRNP